MQHITLGALLVACCLPPLARAETQPQPIRGEPAMVATQTPYRLYNLGSSRVLVTEDDRRIRLDPVDGPRTNSPRFVDVDGDWQLSGGRGRYRLTGPEGSVASLDFTANERPVGTRTAMLHCPVDCDSTAVPASADFTDGPGIAGAQRIDIRPGSCRSYFTDYPPIERGTRIEAALNRQHAMPGLSATVRTFPQVDWYNDEELVVMHSRDLASDSLDASRHPSALFDQLMADGEAIVRDVVERLATQGHITVRDGLAQTRLEGRVEGRPGGEPERGVVLTILVRYGLASPAQRAQIDTARRELARRHGIELRIIEIP